MGLLNKQPPLSPAQFMTAKPVPVVRATLTDREDGGANLTIPVEAPKRMRWLYRFPKGSSKTFELDPIGKFVWQSCDGKTSVQQLIRKLSKQYNLNLREAEVATRQFIGLLMKKRLIGVQVKEKASD